MDGNSGTHYEILPLEQCKAHSFLLQIPSEIHQKIPSHSFGRPYWTSFKNSSKICFRYSYWNMWNMKYVSIGRNFSGYYFEKFRNSWNFSGKFFENVAMGNCQGIWLGFFFLKIPLGLSLGIHLEISLRIPLLIPLEFL